MGAKKHTSSLARIASWNIHGAYDKTNRFRINKLEDSCFLKILEAHDILCVQETHCGRNDAPSDHITQFGSIPHCQNKVIITDILVGCFS